MALSRKYNPTTVHGFHHAGAPAHSPNPKTRNRMANSHVIVLSISFAIVFLLSFFLAVNGFYLREANFLGNINAIV